MTVRVGRCNQMPMSLLRQRFRHDLIDCPCVALKAAGSPRNCNCTRSIRYGRDDGQQPRPGHSRHAILYGRPSERVIADRQEPTDALIIKAKHLKAKLAKLKEEMAAIEKWLLAAPGQQVSLADPDSRSMATSGRGSGVVGYNVRVAVETEHDGGRSGDGRRRWPRHHLVRYPCVHRATRRACLISPG
jgi:hypothetical protein